MARGKHAKAAARRHEADDLDRFARAAAALVVELDQLAEAEAAAAAVDTEAAQLGVLGRARDRAAAPEASRLVDVLDELEAAVAEEEALAEQLADAFRDAIPGLANYMDADGRLEKLEALFDLMHGGNVSGILDWGVTNKHLDQATIRKLQRAKGMRGDDASPTAPGAPATGPKRPMRWLHTQRLIPFEDDADVALVAPYGVIGEPKELQRWLESASVPDAPGDAQLAATPKIAAAAAEARDWRNPFEVMPMFPRPVDATIVQGLYFDLADAFADDLEHIVDDMDAEPDATTLAAREIARLVGSAAPYWLPAGQAAGYADSQPLTDEDRAELRMPHGNTLIVPAEPILIEGHDGVPPTIEDRDEWTKALIDVSDNAQDIALVRRPSRPADSRGGRETLPFGAAAWSYGLALEAVVVEADRSGKLTGRVVLCLAVPSRARSAVMARWAMPAFIDGHALSHVVEQLAAVVAWGTWADARTDDEDDDVSDKTKPRRGASPAAGLVRVLDVAATDSDTGGASTPTGRQVAPHTRRGHWRRQHHGPGNSLVKRVRIAPVLVNAKLGPLAPRVYRIRPVADDDTASPS
ncbi:MAG TPA: hypothetical protein VHD87_14990 [Acidimicrobiales bacterium]|nr:hypothetical protein [Acidimicrobiales bacterium]